VQKVTQTGSGPPGPFFLTQAIFTSLILGLAVSGNLLALLLDAFPATEIFWQLSVPVNRAAAPVNRMIEALGGTGPALPLLLLCAAVLAPIAAYVHRSWLIALLLAQSAAGALAVMTLNLGDLHLRRVATADNLLTINPELISDCVLGFGTIAAVMAVLCCINHLCFVAAIARRRRQRRTG
jgi:hypothetical protein